ncbi:MAG: methionyl-tRNA formyltransferase [Clostridia bacterium]|nr:methionyl-tRNA formyltransferase [Clostridia bacterium]
MGTPDFAVPCLRRLIDDGYPVLATVCQPDKPTGRHQVLTAPPVKQAAIDLGIPVLQPTKIRSGEFADQLRTLEPDFIITAAYGRILPADILQIPPLGCLNVHGSLLPEYRGAAPVQWSIIDGKAETGITIMLMDEGMDTGDILLQGRFPISPDMDAGQLMDALATLGADLLPEAIEGLLAHTLQPIPQDESKATYAAMINRETGLIDWTRPAEDIHNRVRGTYPWPGAWTTLPDGKRLKIHRTAVVSGDSPPTHAHQHTPGTILAAQKTGITIAAGTGAIDLLEIQPEGGKRLKSQDCAHNYPVGLQLGGHS